MNSETKILPVTWWRRLIGLFIDNALILISSNLIAEGMGIEDYIDVAIIIYPIYLILLEGYYGRTLGKLLTGSVVLDNRTFKKCNFIQALGRTFFRLIPIDPFTYLIYDRPRGWHDTLSKTIVINMRDYRNISI